MNRAYAINYDLKSPGRNYSGLYDGIKQSGSWWHYLDSTWIVITNEDPSQLWNRLNNHIDKNDYILIIEVKNNTQGWMTEEAWKWIKDNASR